MSRIISILIFTFACANVSFAQNPLVGRVRIHQSLLKELPPLPQGRYRKTAVDDVFFERLTELRNQIAVLADFGKLDLNKSELEYKTTASLSRVKLKLYRALLEDFRSLDSAEPYRLKTYVGLQGTPLPPAIELRLELAFFLTHGAKGLRESTITLTKIMNQYALPSRESLRDFLGRSEVGTRFTAMIFTDPENESLEFDQRLVRLSEEIIKMPSTLISFLEVSALNLKFEQFKIESRRQSTILNLANILILETLPSIAEISKEVMSQPLIFERLTDRSWP